MPAKPFIIDRRQFSIIQVALQTLIKDIENDLPVLGYIDDDKKNTEILLDNLKLIEDTKELSTLIENNFL